MDWLIENIKQIIMLIILIGIIVGYLYFVGKKETQGDRLVKKYKTIDEATLKNLSGTDLVSAVIANRISVQEEKDGFFRTRKNDISWTIEQQYIYLMWLVVKHLEKEGESSDRIKKTLYQNMNLLADGFAVIGATECSEVILKMGNDTYDESYEEELKKAVEKEKPLDLAAVFITENHQKFVHINKA